MFDLKSSQHLTTHSLKPQYPNGMFPDKIND